MRMDGGDVGGWMGVDARMPGWVPVFYLALCKCPKYGWMGVDGWMVMLCRLLEMNLRKAEKAGKGGGGWCGDGMGECLVVSAEC